MTLRLRDELPLVLIASILAAALAWFAAPMILRLPLGLLAVLILPGYSLGALLFPRADDLEGVERLALSIGASLGLVTVVMLALSYTPWGLAPTAILLALTGWTVLLTAAAWWRRRALPVRPGGRLPGLPRLGRRTHGPVRWIAFTAVSGLVFAVAALATTLAEPPPPATEFYVLGRDGLAQDYPRLARPGEEVVLSVGLTNHEGVAAGYRVVVELDGNRVAEGEAVRVEPGQGWQAPVHFEIPAGIGEREVRLLLYKDDGAQPYRRLRLWLVTSPEELAR